MDNKEELIQIFSNIHDPEIMERFFREIFTEKEWKDLNLRWELMRQLKSGKSQRKIASDLGISLCKITRGAKIIRNPKSITNQLITSKSYKN